jgi:hypothetical protein
MHYVRFLKAPRLKGKSLTALVTITSDLGEDFYFEEVQLAAAIHSAELNGDIYLRKAVTWLPEMRSLPLVFDFEQSDIDWPVVVHVGLRNAPNSDHFEKHHADIELPNIISAWSDVIDPTADIYEATKTVQRRFTPLTGRSINIWEETGESIARHLW